MQRHTLRTFGIWAAIIVSIVWVYPTVGWMTLDEEQRAERAAQWKEEDINASDRTYFAEKAVAVKRWLQFNNDMLINLGLDLQGGVHMVLGLDLENMAETDRQRFVDQGMTDEQIAADLQQNTLRKIERRVAEFEAKEPLIQALGDRQIQIQLPGEKDVDRAKEIVKRTAFLTFHILAQPQRTTDVLRAVLDANDGFERLLKIRPDMRSLQVADENFERVQATLKAAEESGVVPEDLAFAFGRSEAGVRDVYLMNKEPDLTGDGLRLAVARPDPSSPTGAWFVLFENDAENAAKFGEVTAANKMRNMAIVVDGMVESAPTINDTISASGQITGSFTPQQAQDLAIALNSGSLPVPIVEDYTGVVGATLGGESIQRGVLSGIAGIVATVLFLVVYYTVGGVLATVALFCNTLFILALLAYTNSTLTLPGVAGLILTIGMAVDANVLIFERVREELRLGKSLSASLEIGFSKASSAIMDSNITTLIAAAILFQFGTGVIESFAITLSIGVITSVFAALIVLRALFDFFVDRKMVTKFPMMSIIPNDKNIPFMSYRKICYVISIAGIVIGMGAFAARGASNFGVDFTSGTNMIVKLNSEKDLAPAEIIAAIEALGVPDVKAQRYASEAVPNGYSIHYGTRPEGTVAGEGADAGAEEQLAVAKLIEPAATLETMDQYVEIEQQNTVGPAVGDALKRDAVVAVFYSLICIVGYLWYRFEWKFAMAAVLALAHDVLWTLGIFALTGRELSLTVVAAILTVVGYSLNDTIVVFDRIREDLKLQHGKGMPFAKLLDLSINHTLSRTILTSGTTMFILVVLFFFGGASISDFALALLVGIVVGTYSSIFVASPLVNIFHTWENNRRLHKGEKLDTPEKKSRKKAEKAPA